MSENHVLKIDRRCPRCNAHHYHYASRTDGRSAVKVTCAACGHKWRGRLNKIEKEDFEE